MATGEKLTLTSKLRAIAETSSDTYEAFSSETPQSINVRNRPKKLTKAEVISRCELKCTNQKVKQTDIVFLTPISLRGTAGRRTEIIEESK